MRQRAPKRSTIAQRTYANVERDIFEQNLAQAVKAKEHGATIPAEVAAPAAVDGRDPFEMARLANQLLRERELMRRLAWALALVAVASIALIITRKRKQTDWDSEPWGTV